MNTSLSELKILCLDDHPFMLRMLTGFLKGIGIMNIKACTKSKEAIQLLNDEVFDVLVTDIQIDEKNGLDIIKMVRCGHTYAKRELPILVMSGLAEAHIIKKAWLFDVSDFVLKPLKPVNLIEKLKRSLTRNIQLKDEQTYLQVMTSLTKSELYSVMELLDGDDHNVSIYEACPLHSVPAGAILRESIMDPKGNLLLRKGTELNTLIIEKLQKISRQIGVTSLNVEVGAAEVKVV